MKGRGAGVGEGVERDFRGAGDHPMGAVGAFNLPKPCGKAVGP